MKVGLLVAMPVELRGLPTDLPAPELVSGVPFYDLGENLLACAGGVGKVNAALATSLLCDRFGVDLVLNIGIAGSLLPLPTGTLVLASDFVQHDVDTSAVGDPVGLVSTVNRFSFPCDNLGLAKELLGDKSVLTGRVASGDWFAVDSPRAHEIARVFHPTLCEMEGCAAAQVCFRAGVRFMALKAVSDCIFAEGQLGDYFDFGQAIARLGRVALPFARKLAALPR
ncbi:MAG: 5'-methylthioadenosine/S-adenosylhomocysteine nucleosidase [Oscillospiraceae bacterium]